MSNRLYHAPLLLLLWQVAPVPYRPGPDRPVRLRLVSGGGELAFRVFDRTNCAGEALPGSPIVVPAGYRSWGAAAEFHPKADVAVHTAAGRVTDETLERQGWFGAGEVVFNRRWIGLGGGLAAFGGTGGSVTPSGLVRLGRGDGAHFRADYGQPDAFMGLSGSPRAGFGYREWGGQDFSFYTGLAPTPIPASHRRVGAFLDLAVPIGRYKSTFGLLFHGFFSPTVGPGDPYTVGIGLMLNP